MADNYYGHGGGSEPSASTPTAANSNSAQAVEGRLFVGGLSWQTTEESLRWHFEQYGEVSSVELMRDRNTGKPRGFGFVVFKDGASVDVALQTSVHEINHKVVDVKRAQARGVAPPSIHQDQKQSTNAHAADSGNQNSSAAPATAVEEAVDYQKVFVGGLPHEIDREGLKEIFSEFGTVVDAIVMIDQVTGRSRGFGFVTFANGGTGAERSVEAQPLNILGKRVEVKHATPRDAQKKRTTTMASTPAQFLGLRAGQINPASGEFAGLAVAFGRSGWKAGYGSKAFGAAGWNVLGWDQGGPPPERSGFSFSMLSLSATSEVKEEPPRKRAKR